MIPDWKIVGLRYFNVYGPREAHKGIPASMVLHLSRQIKEGKRPRIFKHGIIGNSQCGSTGKYRYGVWTQ